MSQEKLMDSLSIDLDCLQSYKNDKNENDNECFLKSKQKDEVKIKSKELKDLSQANNLNKENLNPNALFKDKSKKSNFNKQVKINNKNV